MQAELSNVGRVSKLLVACWTLSGQDPLMPSSHGIPDMALHSLVENGVFPEWVVEELDFAETSVGLRCAQMTAMLNEAQTRKLSAAPNPSYNVVQFSISKASAVKLLNKLDVSEEMAVDIGIKLRNAITEAVSECS